MCREMEENEPNVKFTAKFTKSTHLNIGQNDVEEMDRRYRKDDFRMITEYIIAMYTGKGSYNIINNFKMLFLERAPKSI